MGLNQVYKVSDTISILEILEWIHFILVIHTTIDYP